MSHRDPISAVPSHESLARRPQQRAAGGCTFSCLPCHQVHVLCSKLGCHAKSITMSYMCDGEVLRSGCYRSVSKTLSVLHACNAHRSLNKLDEAGRCCSRSCVRSRGERGESRRRRVSPQTRPCPFLPHHLLFTSRAPILLHSASASVVQVQVQTGK